jgi:hypothetical protein
VRLLSPAAAAEYCNYNPKSFRELKRNGRGPKYHVIEGSKSVVYTVSDLEEWMFKHPKRSYLNKIEKKFEVNNPWSKKR